MWLTRPYASVEGTSPAWEAHVCRLLLHAWSKPYAQRNLHDVISTSVCCEFCVFRSLSSHIIFAMLIRLVLDGAGLGAGACVGDVLLSGPSWTRLTGLCGVE